MSADRDHPTEAEVAGHADVLHDLPRELWLELAKTFRRAVEAVEDAELPPALRPFRGWKPDRLLGERPRRAIAEALSTQVWLRERLMEQLGDEEVRARAVELDASRLASAEGEGRAAALLAGVGRWGELASLGADVADRMAARHRAAAEQAQRVQSEGGDKTRARLERVAAQLKKEQDRLRRTAEQAETSARLARSERDELAGEVGRLQGEIERLSELLRAERVSHRDRLERLRRRAEAAESKVRIDEAQIVRSAEKLEQVAAELHEAVAGEHVGREPAESASARESGREGRVVPRTVPAAQSGRPCSLPPGLSHSDPDGLRALLAVDGMLVVLDGYNVTKDPRGLADAALDDQRQWLIRLAGGVAARFRVRVVVVFDSGETGSPRAPASRGVVVDFATAEETADDRIVGLLGGLDPDQPATVVTSDRELRERCRAQGADVVPSQVFLRVAGG